MGGAATAQRAEHVLPEDHDLGVYLPHPHSLCQREANYAPITAPIGLLGPIRRPKVPFDHYSNPSCCDSMRFGRKIRPRRSRNATRTPPARFGSPFSLILGLACHVVNDKSFQKRRQT